MLLKSYCLSLYGCELWRLDVHSAIESVCNAYHGDQAYGALGVCRTSVLQIISATVPLFNTM